MATFSAEELNESGIATLTYNVASETGDDFANSGSTFIAVNNEGGETITLTVTAQDTSIESPIYGTLSKANASLIVLAGRIGFIGPFKPPAYNNGSGNVEITYSTHTSVSVAVVTLATGTI